MIEEEDGLR